MDAMGVSVCNGRVIKSCMDPISGVERAVIAIEAIYPPQLPPWLGFVVPQNRDFTRISANISVCVSWWEGIIWLLVNFLFYQTQNLLSYQIFCSTMCPKTAKTSCPQHTQPGLCKNLVIKSEVQDIVGSIQSMMTLWLHILTSMASIYNSANLNVGWDSWEILILRDHESQSRW